METIVYCGKSPGLSMEYRKRSGPFQMDVSHAHAFCEAYYLRSGECVYSLNGRSYSLDKGSFVFIPAHLLHRTAASSHERILLEIDPQLLRGFGAALPIAKAQSELVIRLDEAAQSRTEAFFSCIAECLSKKATGYETQARLYLASLFAYVGGFARLSPVCARTLTSRQQKAEQIIRYIENNYMRSLSLNDLARDLFSSKYYLAHLFRQETGFTVFSYLTAVRLQQARTLLTETSLCVSDVAEQSGFPSQSHFNRIFLRETGVSPLKYRKANRPPR